MIPTITPCLRCLAVTGHLETISKTISRAWEYLVEVLKLDPNCRLVCNRIRKAIPQENERHNEAAAIRGQFLPTDRIINGNKHDNQEMGIPVPAVLVQRFISTCAVMPSVRQLAD